MQTRDARFWISPFEVTKNGRARVWSVGWYEAEERLPSKAVRKSGMDERDFGKGFGFERVEIADLPPQVAERFRDVGAIK